MNIFRLVWNFAIISLKKEYEYKFELCMVFVQLLFNISFTMIFWYTLFQYLPVLHGWKMEELLLYTAIVSLGEGVAGIFFGFRDMPERIIQGELDKYLVKPVNLLVCLLFENVSVFYFLEQIVVSVLIVVILIGVYHIHIVAAALLPAVLILLAGVLIIQLMIGIITLASFWVGRIENIRNLLMKVLEVKEYPLNVFPGKLQWSLTYLIPVFFLAYYPTVLLLGKETVDYKIMLYEFIMLAAVSGIFTLVWRCGLKRYEANGG